MKLLNLQEIQMRRLCLNKEKNIKIAIFASGSGTNFEAVAQAVKQGKIKGNLELLVCDNAEAYALKRAEKLKIPAAVILPKSFISKKEFELKILEQLRAHSIDLIVLAGYMRIIGNTLLEAYPEKILNIHPSLLPDYPGKQGIKDAYNDGAIETGVTVHLVDQGIDTGPILAQERIMIEPEETLNSLEERIHRVEHKLYPVVIQQYIEKLQKEQIDK